MGAAEIDRVQQRIAGRGQSWRLANGLGFPWRGTRPLPEVGTVTTRPEPKSSTGHAFPLPSWAAMGP
jgi:hypothetical protein